MSLPPFSIVPLAKQDRSAFRSGVEPLDRYFSTQASQDARLRVATCFILTENASGVVAGYYTLSAADIALPEIPADLARRLPRDPTVPAARIGRLAVDERFRGQKLGSVLLYDAVRRAASSQVAIFAIIVDAKDDTAAVFYRHHGFVSYNSSARSMIAPIDELLR